MSEAEIANDASDSEPEKQPRTATLMDRPTSWSAADGHYRNSVLIAVGLALLAASLSVTEGATLAGLLLMLLDGIFIRLALFPGERELALSSRVERWVTENRLAGVAVLGVALGVLGMLFASTLR